MLNAESTVNWSSLTDQLIDDRARDQLVAQKGRNGGGGRAVDALLQDVPLTCRLDNLFRYWKRGEAITTQHQWPMAAAAAAMASSSSSSKNV